MKVLTVTGRLAEESVRRSVSGSKYDVDVHTIPVSVAAFITPESAADALSRIPTEGYDFILLPGTVLGDVSPVEDATGVPTFKGPTNARDLDLVLDLLGEIELSKTHSASEFIREVQRERALSEIDEIERNWTEVLRECGGLVIGGEGYEVPVGRAFPMRVIAEIVNAPTLDLDAVKKRALYYEAEPLVAGGHTEIGSRERTAATCSAG